MAHHIRDKVHNNQYVDFSGLKFGRVRPSDIDGFMIFNNLTIIFEFKHVNTHGISAGQQRILKTMCDRMHSDKAHAIVIYATHSNDAYMSDLDAGNAIVQSWYFGNSEWRKAKSRVTAREFVAWLMRKYNQF